MDAALWAEIRRLHFREHLSQREIARQLAVAPRTVRKALRQERFEPAQRAPRPSHLDPYKDALRALLARHPALSAIRLQAEAKALGYGGSYSVLKRFVRSIRPASLPEAFLRLSFPPGDAAQVDWTACGSLLVEGKPRRLSAFLYVLCHSRALYVELTLCEQLEVFLACHERALACAVVARRASPEVGGRPQGGGGAGRCAPRAPVRREWPEGGALGKPARHARTLAPGARGKVPSVPAVPTPRPPAVRPRRPRSRRGRSA